MGWIDLDRWPRKSIYSHFMGYKKPWYTISMQLECGGVVERSRNNRSSLFGEMLHDVMLAANGIAPLRQRLRADGVYEHEQLDPSFTLDDGAGSFSFHVPKFHRSRERFLEVMEQLPRTPNLNAPLDANLRDDLLFVSCLPWVDICHVEPALRCGEFDSIPMLHWGRIAENRVGMSITAHHALVDGQHVAKFVHAVEELWR